MASDLVRVGDYEQLALICWQLDPGTLMPGEDVLDRYERNWRHVDTAHLTDAERALIDRLTRTYGRGQLLV